MINPTVFVVDDDIAVADSVSALLEADDFNVETFSSAEEFLESFDRNSSGCMILDLRLNGLNGLELLKKLRADGIGIPAIMISGHADDEITRQALNQGAQVFLQKPFTADALLSAVDQVLRTE